MGQRIRHPAARFEHEDSLPPLTAGVPLRFGEVIKGAANLICDETRHGTKRSRAISDALKRCDQVILATDCDREGQLIGQEILEHFGYRGRVLRALFTAQDPKSRAKRSPCSSPTTICARSMKQRWRASRPTKSSIFR